MPCQKSRHIPEEHFSLAFPLAVKDEVYHLQSRSKQEMAIHFPEGLHTNGFRTVKLTSTANVLPKLPGKAHRVPVFWLPCICMI